jgi:antitoxin FitA
MRIACAHVLRMEVMVQIRNVPEALHRRLKSRAALSGLSLSDYLLAEIKRAAERPTPEELAERLEKLAPVRPSLSPADAVRAEREGR